MLDDLLKSGQKDIHIIVFRIGTEEYAMPIISVQEIIMPQMPTRIPKSPAYVEGVINLRGHIIPVIDGKKKFMLDKCDIQDSDEKRFIILEIEGEMIGLIVDSVSEVVHLDVHNIEPPPVDIDSEIDFLWGVGKFQERLLILLDPQKILTITENKDIKKIVQVTEAIKQINTVEKEIIKQEKPKRLNNKSNVSVVKDV